MKKLSWVLVLVLALSFTLLLKFTFPPLSQEASHDDNTLSPGSSLDENALSPETSLDDKTLSVAVVIAEKADVYSDPGISSEKMASLQKGDEYPILKAAKDYYQIQMLGGQTGWVKKSEVQYKKLKRIVMGWNYGGNSGLYMQQSASPDLHVVSPRWYMLTNTDPMVSITVDPAYVKWAHDNGKQVWPLFGNRFDPALTDALLANPVNRRKVVSAIKESLVNHQIDGINVDFENVKNKNKADLVAFVQELSSELKPVGKVVSVDVARTGADPNWSGSFDRHALGQAADYIIMMGYDEHWKGMDKAGSVASLPWTEEGIRLLMNEVPSHKIILGVPFYTREWVTDASGKIKSIDRSMTEVEKLIAEKGLQKVWDDRAKQYYVEFTAENGEKHQIWVEDRQSMELRRNLVDKYRLIGVSAWRIGLETPDIWPVFDEFR